MTTQTEPTDSALWSAMTAGHQVRTEWRSARRRRALLGRLPTEHEPDPADDAAGRLDDERAMARMLAAVRKLPRAEREAVALCLWSGVSYPQAAAALGITEVAVRSRVSRARARLTGQLGGDVRGTRRTSRPPSGTCRRSGPRGCVPGC